MRTRAMQAKPGLLAALAMATLLPAAVVSAQSVQGIARIVGAGPSPQTSITMIDASGAVVVSTMTTTSGTYSLHAPVAGAFRVRARRLGFAPDSSTILNLVAGERATFDPVLTPVSVRLPTVTVAESRQCVSTTQAGATALQLWQAAQNALSTTVASESGDSLRLVLDRFEREFDAETGDQIRSRTWIVDARGSEPYASIAPDSLARYGFARTTANGSMVYYAPDARTLVSQAFAASHCLRPVLDSANRDLVGLGFEPVATKRNGRTDVAGVLWFDRQTSELRYLDYSYTGVGSGANAGATKNQRAYGRVDYRRLPSGAWIVDKWFIRAPVVKTYIEPHYSYGALTRTDTTRTIPTTFELGGDVRSLSGQGAATASAPSASGVVRGNVVDADHVLGRAIVAVTLLRTTAKRGTGAPASSAARRTLGGDSSLVFRFDSLTAGEYRLHLAAPRLDTLGLQIPDTTLLVEPGSEIATRVVLLPSSAGVVGKCAQAPGPMMRIIAGTVRDSVTDSVIVGATVQASWMANAQVYGGGSRVSMNSVDRSTITDRNGRYVLCGLPAGRTLTLRASQGSRQGLSIRVNPGSDPVLMPDVALAALPSRQVASAASAATSPDRSYGTIDGTVVDSAGMARAGVEVSLLDAKGQPARTTRTGADGGFRMDGVPVGSRRVRLRLIAFRPVTMTLNVNPGEVTHFDAALSVASNTLKTVTITRARTRVDTIALAPGVADRMRNGQGSYITYEDIQRRKPIRTTELFRTIQGVQVTKTGAVNNTRGVISLLTPGCKYGIPIYLNGSPMSDPHIGADTLSGTDPVGLVNPKDIAAIEVYRGAAELPAGLPRNPCGGVFIWTR